MAPLCVPSSGPRGSRRSRRGTRARQTCSSHGSGRLVKTTRFWRTASTALPATSTAPRDSRARTGTPNAAWCDAENSVGFVTVTSDFYPELCGYYEEEAVELAQVEAGGAD